MAMRRGRTRANCQGVEAAIAERGVKKGRKQGRAINPPHGNALNARNYANCPNASRDSIIFTGLIGRKVRDTRTSPARLHRV